MKLVPLLFSGLLLAGCQAPATLPATFIVFFHSGSAELTEDANASIARAAEGVRASHPSQVAIACVAQGDNLRLAAPRYQAVQRALIARGAAARGVCRAWRWRRARPVVAATSPQSARAAARVG